MQTSCYPDVAVEEAERLFDFLGLSLSDVADSVNEPVVYVVGAVEKPLPSWRPITDNMLMHTCLNHLFYEVCDSGNKQWSDYPNWVSELYQRASACEVQQGNVLAGAVVVL